MNVDQETSADAAPVRAFCNELQRRQRAFWWVVAFWFVFELFFVVITTQLMKNVPDSLIYGGFYGAAILLIIPAGYLSRLKCPHCHGAAGAVPLFRYRIIFCRNCGQRIVCRT